MPTYQCASHQDTLVLLFRGLPSCRLFWVFCWCSNVPNNMFMGASKVKVHPTFDTAFDKILNVIDDICDSICVHFVFLSKK